MKNSDEAVERVLAGLREAEALEGMERRILEAVREGVPERGRWAARRWAAPLRLAGTMSWATAAAGVAVIAGVLCWSPLRGSHMGGRAGNPNLMAKGQVGAVAAPVAEFQAAAAGPVQLPPRRLTAQSGNRIRARRPAGVREGDSGDLRKVSAVSFPAPPMPLTEQERLLLNLAHRGDPELLAMLNPVARATRDAEEKAQVENFFEPATTEGDHE